jgi:predicted exporter
VKLAALVWLAVVVAACVYLTARLIAGVEFQTDLMALLPQEERDPGVQRAKNHAAAVFGRRIVILVGHAERTRARDGGAAMAKALQQSGLTQSLVYEIAGDGLRNAGEIFFPYRFGLLSAADRQRLEQGRAQEIVTRTRAALFGPVGFVDARLLRADPFLLLPSYLASLPSPLARMTPDEGVVSVVDGGKTYVLVSAQLNDNIYAMSVQERFVDLVDAAEQALKAQNPDLVVLRAGPVFYARAGAATAMSETSTIGLAAMIGTIVLIFGVFRSLRPLWHNILTLAVGVSCAMAACLALFGTVHVGALLFGVSLIGIAVDYSLHYECERFADRPAAARARARHVLPGIALGLVTTLIGYLTLLLAPFPGLHQMAIFSTVGLIAAFLTVVLWLPAIDTDAPLRHGHRMLRAAGWLWRFWQEPRNRRVQILVLGLGLVATIAGAMHLHVDDDVRRLQALPPDLTRQEAEIRRLTGSTIGGQFFLVQGRDTQAVLETEEKLVDRLQPALAQGSLAGVQAIASVVPSIARQRENRRLVDQKLFKPYLATLADEIGLSPTAPEMGNDFLTPEKIGPNTSFSFLRDLVVARELAATAHIVALQGVAQPDEIRALGESVANVTFVDPTADFSRLLGQYRQRAVILLAVSALLMAPLMMWRYGWRKGLRVLVPAALAVGATPALVAWGGLPFTFFNAIALVLALSISIDYAIFCMEADLARQSTTMLGIWLATLTTILSFGLLALSSVAAVHAFGLTLAVGVTLSFLLSPMAGRPADAGGRS